MANGDITGPTRCSGKDPVDWCQALDTHAFPFLKKLWAVISGTHFLELFTLAPRFILRHQDRLFLCSSLSSLTWTCTGLQDNATLRSPLSRSLCSQATLQDQRGRTAGVYRRISTTWGQRAIPRWGIQTRGPAATMVLASQCTVSTSMVPYQGDCERIGNGV